MSVEPVQTEFGRKTRIHQSSCNKDFSCVKGFCPSFLTITPNAAPESADGKKKKKGRLPALDRALPDPVFKVDPNGFGIHVMGIGGTGSVTVVATIANAARIDGKWAVGLDQTGLAQKGGTVISDIKITATQFDGSNKISDGSTDLYLGFDILNATDNKNLDKCHPERTIAIVSTGQAPTGYMVSDKSVQFPNIDRLTDGIDRVTRKDDNVYLDGRRWPRACSATHGDQQLHGRRGLPGRRAADQRRRLRDCDQAGRRRCGHEPARLQVGPHGGGRPRLRPRRDPQVRSQGASSPRADRRSTPDRGFASVPRAK